MLLANFNRKEHLRHRAVSLRQHGFLVFLMNILPSLIRSLSSLRPAISVQLALVFLLWRSYQAANQSSCSCCHQLVFSDHHSSLSEWQFSHVRVWTMTMHAVYRSFVVAKLSCTPLLVHCGGSQHLLTGIDLRAFSDTVAVIRPPLLPSHNSWNKPSEYCSSRQILQVTHSSSSDSRQSTSVL